MHTRGLITGNSFIELQSCVPAESVVLCAARRIEPLSSVLVKWQLSGLKYFFNDTAEPLKSNSLTVYYTIYFGC